MGRRRVGWRAGRGPLGAAVATLAAVVLLAGCGSGGTGEGAPVSPAADASSTVLDDTAALDGAGVARLVALVVGTVPHDPAAFTEGFELTPDNRALFEGTGKKGASELRETDPTTGAVRRTTALPTTVFGEGITITASRIWQMTWRDGDVYDRNPTTLAVNRTLRNDREGWGICFDGTNLITSDGSSDLVVRDPKSFAPLRVVPVRAAGQPVPQINELECTPQGVLANVWKTDKIIRIDPTGRVNAVVDASNGLLPKAQRKNSDAVLNGIAWVHGTDQFLLAGKTWPTTYRVRFVPAGT